MNKWHLLNTQINEAKAKLDRHLDQIDAEERAKIVERYEFFRKKYEKIVKMGQQGKAEEIIATNGKDIEKYDTKVKMYLVYITENKIKGSSIKPGRIEEVSA